MADPRFYDNRGPFMLAEICAKAGIAVPSAGAARIFDLAGLDGAGSQHLSFFDGSNEACQVFARSGAGFCLVPALSGHPAPPSGMVLLPCVSVSDVFAVATGLFYPLAAQVPEKQAQPVSPDARLGRDVVLGSDVVIGPGAEIGPATKVGAGSVIGPGVAIGQACEIGANVTITNAYLGDRVTILPDARIGQPAQEGAPLGRVIVQDGTVIGHGCVIDRGTLGDTVIGEGSQIEAKVQVGHDAHIGRHCVLKSGVGAGAQIGDFAVWGGQDHGQSPAKPVIQGL